MSSNIKGNFSLVSPVRVNGLLMKMMIETSYSMLHLERSGQSGGEHSISVQLLMADKHTGSVVRIDSTPPFPHNAGKPQVFNIHDWLHYFKAGIGSGCC